MSQDGDTLLVVVIFKGSDGSFEGHGVHSSNIDKKTCIVITSRFS